jgi:HK97 family phage prohead protease
VGVSLPELERKVWPLTEAKASDAGNGSFSGYASVFGVRDLGGDVVQAGAYADTLPQFLARGFIPWGHDYSALPVATVAQAYEDAHGLYIAAEFHSTPDAQAARKVVQERLARGKSMGLSIGYLAQDFAPSPDGRLLKKIHLLETSLVPVPMQPEAGVTAVKAADPEGKAGRRNSASDAGRIQALHDTAVELGAACASEPKAIDPPTEPADLLAALEAFGTTPDLAQLPQLPNLLKRARELCRTLDGIQRRGASPHDPAVLAARFRTFETLYPEPPSAPRGPFAHRGGR